MVSVIGKVEQKKMRPMYCTVERKSEGSLLQSRPGLHLLGVMHWVAILRLLGKNSERVSQRAKWRSKCDQALMHQRYVWVVRKQIGERGWGAVRMVYLGATCRGITK